MKTCNLCGGDMGVTNTRTASDGMSIRRTRICPDCDNRIYTLEVDRHHLSNESKKITNQAIGDMVNTLMGMIK